MKIAELDPTKDGEKLIRILQYMNDADCPHWEQYAGGKKVNDKKAHKIISRYLDEAVDILEGKKDEFQGLYENEILPGLY